MLKLYRDLEEHIKEKRKENPFYAEYFEWLAKKIEKKYGKNGANFKIFSLDLVKSVLLIFIRSLKFLRC